MTQINVTQEHIDKGVQGSCYGCPVAIALDEQTNIPADRQWHVMGFYARLGRPSLLSNDTSGPCFKMPSAVGRFIMDFDHGRPVKPFSFSFVWEPSCSPD